MRDIRPRCFCVTLSLVGLNTAGWYSLCPASLACQLLSYSASSTATDMTHESRVTRTVDSRTCFSWRDIIVIIARSALAIATAKTIIFYRCYLRHGGGYTIKSVCLLFSGPYIASILKAVVFLRFRTFSGFLGVPTGCLRQWRRYTRACQVNCPG